MLNTSKRFISTVVDRDRVSSADVGKERFPYTRIPYIKDASSYVENLKLKESVYFLRAIANDKKRLYQNYVSTWVLAVNSMLYADGHDFRIYVRITPDFRYKVVKYTVVPKADKRAFAESKQQMLDALAKYQYAGYLNGTYGAIQNASLEPSIIEVIECPFEYYLGFARDAAAFLVVPPELHTQMFEVDPNVIPGNIRAIIEEYLKKYGTVFALEDNDSGLEIDRPTFEDPEPEEEDDNG